MQPPGFTAENESAQPSMLYVYDDRAWEYKVLVRDPARDNLPDAAELDALGAAGWEMTGVLAFEQAVRYYFKRPRRS
jgi:hypothetical protein